jgi:hypothetical protein
MKLLWDREGYVMCGSSNDRRGLAWFRAGIWKLRGTRRGLEIGRCPLCNGEEDAVHILIKCPGTRRLREHLLSRKCQIINEELAYKKIISFGLFHQNLVHFSLLSHACHIPRPPHSP